MKTLKVKPESEAEMYFMKDLMPACMDKVSCMLGTIVGRNYNQYSITDDDYYRIRSHILKKKGLES